MQGDVLGATGDLLPIAVRRRGVEAEWMIFSSVYSR
jgi:hypothetical protein